jgi:hypothetical protein
MSATDEPAVGEADLDQLMASILAAAGANLLQLSEPDLDFLPARMRRGVAAVCARLKHELRTLLELRTGYGDLLACRLAATRYPWKKGELTPYQHLRLVWSQFIRLRDGFERLLTELRDHHRGALELFSLDGGAADDPPPRTRVDIRESSPDRWFEVAPGPEAQPVFMDMRVASDWSDPLPPFAGHADSARNALLSAIDAEIGARGNALAAFLTAHGPSLTDMIVRYNDMAGNFRRLYKVGRSLKTRPPEDDSR